MSYSSVNYVNSSVNKKIMAKDWLAHGLGFIRYVGK